MVQGAQSSPDKESLSKRSPMEHVSAPQVGYGSVGSLAKAPSELQVKTVAAALLIEQLAVQDSLNCVRAVVTYCGRKLRLHGEPSSNTPCSSGSKRTSTWSPCLPLQCIRRHKSPHRLHPRSNSNPSPPWCRRRGAHCSGKTRLCQRDKNGVVSLPRKAIRATRQVERYDVDGRVTVCTIGVIRFQKSDTEAPPV